MRKKAKRRANLGNDILLSVQEGQSRIQQLDMPLVKRVSEPTLEGIVLIYSYIFSY
jgi:hypothetical protein